MSMSIEIEDASLDEMLDNNYYYHESHIFELLRLFIMEKMLPEKRDNIK